MSSLDQQVVIVYDPGAYLRVSTGESGANLKVLGVAGRLDPHKPGLRRSQ
jgi:hypothetical protein